MKKNLFIMFLGLILFTQQAHAYLDPGSGSMVLQIILASVVTLILTVKVWFLKVVSFLNIFRKINRKNNDN